MTFSFLRVARWVFAFSLVAPVSTVPNGAAKAQFFDPFYQFFAPQPQYTQPVAPRRKPRYSYRRGVLRVWVPDRPRVRHARRLERERIRHAGVPRRVRLASLPGSVPVSRVRISPVEKEPVAREKASDPGKAKLTPREPIGDPVAALMKDPTLRPGDIVVMPGGAKVFKGGASVPHRLSDFEDVSRTKLVGAKTRRQLTAMPIQPPAPRPQTETAERQPGKQGGDTDEKVAATGSLPGKSGSSRGR